MIIFEECFGIGKKGLILNGNYEADIYKSKCFFDMINLRTKRKPVQYITGNCEFMGLKLAVGEGVLIPRDDTEVLVRETLSILRSLNNLGTLKILDLCSGTGAIALSIKKILGEKADVLALEFSDLALGYLKKNAYKNNLEIEIIKGDIFDFFDNLKDESLDCIISNPPYIPTKDICMLEEEVKYEPKMALDGGSDGLKFYKCISEKWVSKIKHGGILSVEVGINQINEVKKIFKQCGLKNNKVYYDINDIPRVLVGKK